MLVVIASDPNLTGLDSLTHADEMELSFFLLALATAAAAAAVVGCSMPKKGNEVPTETVNNVATLSSLQWHFRHA